MMKGALTVVGVSPVTQMLIPLRLGLESTCIDSLVAIRLGEKNAPTIIVTTQSKKSVETALNGGTNERC